MMEIVCTGLVEHIDVLIATLQFSPDALFLGEILPTHVIQDHERQNLLRFSPFHPDIHAANYTSGRIFHPNGELRWERSRQKPGMYQVVYLGVERPIADLPRNYYLIAHDDPAAAQHQRDKQYQRFFLETSSYYLFGKRLESPEAAERNKRDKTVTFAEARIPRLLSYPTSPTAERVKIEVRAYLDPENRQILHFRFARLHAAKEAL